MTIGIEKITNADQEVIAAIAQSFWGDKMVIVHNEIFDLTEAEGIKAVQDGEIVGMMQFQLQGDVCEILSLVSLKENQSIGTALIREIERIAENQGCSSLSLTTTNDNLKVLGFYQRQGFHFAALFPGQVVRSRQMKPSIPAIGEHGIPIRDELRLEKHLL
jgi:ribosomal protein S18 acetylase RimI-like enzyme